jgi:hypothetical protein
MTDDMPPSTLITQEQFDETLLQGFLLAYRIIYEVYEVKPPEDVNMDKTWLRLADVAEGRVIMAIDPTDPNYGPAETEEEGWARMQRIVVSDKANAEKILRALERIDASKRKKRGK